MAEAQTREMVPPDLLEILCCPETHQKLQIAPPELVESLNKRIAAGTLRNRGGEKLVEAMDSGLVRADGKYVYPIRGRIPVLMIDEGIPIDG